MRRLRWVPLAVLVLGVVEFVILIGVAKLVGTGFAVAGLVLLSLLGALLVKQEGLRGWRRMRTAARAGQPAGDEVLNGVVGLLAALLLLIPGYLTAAVGLVLLIPPIRRLAARRGRVITERRVPGSLAADLFGPRQVKVKTNNSPSKTTVTEVLEGEIVDE